MCVALQCLFQLSATATNTRKHFAKNKHKADFTNQNTTTWPSPSFRFHFFIFIRCNSPQNWDSLYSKHIAIAVKTKQTSQLAKKRDHASFQKPKKKAACVDCVVKSKAGSTVSTATAATAPKEYRAPSCFFSKGFNVCVGSERQVNDCCQWKVRPPDLVT
jgi:hypothetical protein